MRRICILALAVGLAPQAGMAPAGEPAPDAKAVAFFEKEVRPLLVSRCYPCHSTAGKKRGGLVLDSAPGWHKGGDSGPVLEPGDPDASLLIQAVRHQGDGPRMPPSGKLPAHEIETLVKWVRLGAPDPRTGTATTEKPDPARQHWAYQPPRRPALPAVRDADWCLTSVDRFIRARQEQAGLRPVADADRYALVRRATFDLVGLPPTPEEVEAALNDKSDAWFEKVVDRLLASRHFGERWGRHWLDLARYAESLGNDNNYLFVDAWRYRDYVIDSFNRDKPYDRFVIEQLAGDLLPYENQDQRDEQVIATGFLALGPFDFSKLSPQLHLDRVDEQIDVTTKAFLATTVSCARCHDHKYDPIPTTDYYALAGIFSSTSVRKTVVYTKGKHTFVRADTGVPLQGYEQAPVDEFIRLQEDLYGGRQAVVRMGWEYNKQLTAAKSTPDATEAASYSARAEAIRLEMDRRVAASLAAERRLRNFPALPPTALAVQGDRPHDQYVRIRGEVDSKGALVPRGFVTALSTGKTIVVDRAQSGRLELARWIADRDNPVTARVMVNRVWMHLFGAGLVPTVDNFGVNGEAPSHPELLDYLALRFMDEGWSVKRLIRLLMLSHVYRLSVTRDPACEEVDGDNRLLWRMNRRRLEAEAIRDAMLSFSGQLDLDPRHRSQTAELGVGAMRYLADRIHFNENKRSIYLPQPRGKTPEVIALFDGPDQKEVVGQRESTTIPAQALFLLNSPFAIEQSRLAAGRLLEDRAIDDNGRIDLAFRLALGRPPSARERVTARGLLAESADQHAGWTGLCQLLMALPEFRFVH